MKYNHSLLPAIIGCLSWFSITSPSQGATMVGLWQLDGDLTNSLAGSSLTATNWTPTYSNVTIGGAPSDVLNIPALTPTQLLSFANPTGANGGGTRTNDYSIGWDVNFLTFQTYESLLQTNPANNTDVTVYMNSSGAINAFGSTGLLPSTWYRLVMTSKNNGGSTDDMTLYINGVLYSSNVFGTDSNFALTPTSLNHIFSDDSGDTGDAYLNSFALWNGALTGAEVLAFGGPSSGGFAVPEPGIPSLFLIGLAGAMLQRRRRLPPKE